MAQSSITTNCRTKDMQVTLLVASRQHSSFVRLPMFGVNGQPAKRYWLKLENKMHLFTNCISKLEDYINYKYKFSNIVAFLKDMM